MSGLTIGDVADASGVKVTTIRFYETRGLLPVPPRSGGNRRVYEQTDVRRLRFIRHARDLGFELPAIQNLLNLSDDPGQDCAAIDAIARNHREEVDRRISQLTALRAELDRMIGHCGTGHVSDCRVIEVLADHTLCASDHTHAA